MTDNILHFPNDRGIRQPIAQFMRLGDSGHRKLAAIHAVGRLPASRVVVDASRLRHQKELVDAFQAAGAEIVLDTKVAELAAAQKYSGYAQGARGQPSQIESYWVRTSLISNMHPTFMERLLDLLCRTTSMRSGTNAFPGGSKFQWLAR